jgi:hypothetical protein
VAVIKPTKPQEEAAAAPAVATGQAEASTVTFQQSQNGLQVFLKRDASLPLVTIQLWAGRLAEDAIRGL